MGGGSNQIPRTLLPDAEQRRREAEAQGGASPGEGLEGEAFFNDQPFELLNFDPVGDRGQPSFTFAQNGVEFGSGTFESQSALAKQFNPDAEFSIGGDRFNPTIEQGGLRFALPSPTPLRSHVPNTDPGELSPNAQANPPLLRPPRDGALNDTAAARALSRSGNRSSSSAGVRRPRLLGF